MIIWDLYIEHPSGPDNTEIRITICSIPAPNPDDAMWLAKLRGKYLPEGGDVITRCVMVNRGKK